MEGIMLTGLALVVAFLALLAIIAILVLPGSEVRQATTAHEQRLDEMQAVSDEAKQHISDLHRAYRADLTRAARERTAPPRRTP